MTIEEIVEAMNNCANGKCEKCPIDCRKYLIEYLGDQCRQIVEGDECPED